MADPPFDAIVIGAGSVGNPTAYFLAREGLRTLVLDELSASGQGQNKAAIGGVRATHSDPAKITLCRRSLDIFSHWKQATGTDIGWKKGGYCFPAFTEKVESTVRGLLPIQKKFRLNIDWLDAEAIRKVVPGINPNGLLGGTYSPEDGQVSPLLAAESFTREAVRLGAQYRYREPVTSLVMKGNSVVGVRTPNGEYRAETVINTSGVDATAISKMAGLDVPILPDSHEGGISAPVKPFLDPLIVDLRPGPEGKTINFYFGQDANGQIIFCYTPITPIAGTSRNSTYEFMPIVAARLVEVVPRLKNLTIRRVWRGLYPMTPDGSPIVGRPAQVDGFVLGVGMCGQGFMLGPGVGESLAALVAHGAPAIDREVFELLSPSRDLYRGKKEALK
ncbi:MAG TPA: FAD-binding oxidoreductase [Thermoplasmata archaeon]|jgi:sarcosine oxidase subunit beta|nr:FAD-binding oxidoreductase [Thermoplasmata archaeon]